MPDKPIRSALWALIAPDDSRFNLWASRAAVVLVGAAVIALAIVEMSR